ncbi:MAG: fumarate hydratase [Tepidanaerobacter acetatoxydans]|uniref:Hydro-lyase, Fe-S type, tartrate/fumarate subfamily, alpha subunit n=1 Tax=Tepidanaerobacter acetatoxydans (strain DSM 21804 / JCM 16047 / Re1) TaxID=1209989 RepID=F4LVB9_TEPAE|nr:fumarate hydratase [Tepidanaerobacter acetatoxydans]AEE90694.1 hydro-lyase, Fe-S type, tartrate/fumarate subfamily, alpha subunit [Tepidanaerobacter acetatoxydans Re1]NLU09474.1 fumarate hydratase [Tepidanaerobacter acetatoxydans]CCP25230.1 Hydro-lyase, Fe-S type, tartrate/fumarate subfamily, alpha subunit [Tepidanaerobacter acetatoxydans Re1]
MREVNAKVIQQTVKELFLEANYVIGKDILDKLRQQYETEESPIGKSVINQIIKNDEIAVEEKIALCQDTGMAVVFIELGQEVAVVGGDFNDAINQGVKQAYTKGYLRKSVVNDPLFDRVNTKYNIPAITHITIVPGDKITINVTAKGFGSENMSRIKMLKPADGIQGVKDFIVKTAVEAGPNPCPPIILGVGIGGTMEMAAILAKKATTRPVGEHNSDVRYARLEDEILNEINKSGIGPAGLGGRTTALSVNIEYFPTHIAGLPVAVNICCHAARHAQRVI